MTIRMQDRRPHERVHPDTLRRLAQLAEDRDALVVELEAAEAEAKRIKARIERIDTMDMVDAMHQAGVDDFTRHGRKYGLRLWVGGVWPKDPAAARDAEEYLVARRAGGLLKVSVQADFGRDERADAEDAFRALSGGTTARTSIRSAVHPMTLRSWARKRLEDGDEIDLDRLGLRAGHRVTVRKGRRG